MPLYYSSILNKYIGKYNLFTSQEVIDADHLEKQWQESQINYSFHQLLEIFPQAKPTVKKNLKAEIKQFKQDLIKAEEVRTDFNIKVLNRAKPQDCLLYSLIRDMFYVKPLTDGREKKIKQNYFMLSALRPKTKELKTGKITDWDITNAKMIPIENLYSGQLKKTGITLVGRCPFHNDKGPSFTIYTNTNRFWCFGCNIGNDPIDFIQKSRNCTFLEAIKILCHE